MNPARKEPEYDMDTYAGRLQAKLSELRQRKGLTVEEFADSIGVDKFRVYKWEKGTATPHYNLLPTIAAALGFQKVTSVLPEK